MDPEASTAVQRALARWGRFSAHPSLDPTDPAPRCSLTEVFADIVSAAARQMEPHYHSAAEVESDPERPILDFVTQDFRRRISISVCPRGGAFGLFTKYADDGYMPEHGMHALLRPTGYLPDRTELMIVTDLDPDRLIAVFAMIRAYTHADIPTLEAGTALERQFIATYRHQFGFADFDAFAGPSSDDDEDQQPVPA